MSWVEALMRRGGANKTFHIYDNGDDKIRSLDL